MTTIDDLVAPSVGRFQRAKVDPRTLGIKTLVWGGPKVGKNHLAFTYPEPIYLIDLDMGSLPLLATTFKDREIYRSAYRVNETLDPGSCREVLIQLHQDYIDAIAQLTALGHGTLVVDTITALTQLIQTVKLAEVMNKRLAATRKKGGLADPDDIKIFPFDYAAANQYTSSFLRRVMEVPEINAAFIAQGKEKYNEKGQPTGVLEYAGYKEAPYALDATLRLGTKPGGSHVARVDYSRFDRTLNGVEIDDPDYQTIHSIFTGS